MTQKPFGVKQLNVIGVAGTPTIESAGSLNIGGQQVAITTNTSVTGVLTATTLAGTLQTAAQPNVTSLGTLTTLNVSGDVSIGGTLTYEDVKNVDSVGLITARSGIEFGVSGVGGTITATGQAEFAGVVTATSFSGSGANLTTLNASELDSGTIPDARFPATLPAASGANLTSLNASELDSGTIPDARFPATLPAVSGANLTNLPSSGGSTEWTITSNGSSDYRFAGTGFDGTENDPTIYLTRGEEYKFINNSGGSHPFQIRTAINGSAYNDGITNNGTSNGTLTWDVQMDAPNILYYQCTSHSGMVGKIYIGNSGSSIDIDGHTETDTLNASGIATAASFVKSGGTSSEFLKADGSVDSSTYLTSFTETDPIVGAINGIVKSNGSGTISAATAGTDYLTPTGDGSGLSGLTGISTASSNIQATWTVTSNGSSAYRFTGPGNNAADDDPDLYLVRGQRYRFINSTGSSHPFAIRVSNGGSAYTDGVSGSQSGTQDFNVQHDAPSTLVYQCTLHSGMVGNIYIIGGPQVISGVVTATGIEVTGNIQTQQLNVSGAGAGTTSLIVSGDARITGILTVGSSSLTLDGTNNVVNVGTALTLGHTQGIQFHTQNLHSQGFEVNNVNATGIVTATTFIGDGSALSGIVTSIVAGSNITLTGGPTGIVTIASSGGGGSSGIEIENNGTSVGTGITSINFSTNVTATASGGIATVTASGGGSGPDPVIMGMIF
nr:putative T4-like proximal tail fiber [uncultured Mediterranean phage uvMED]